MRRKPANYRCDEYRLPIRNVFDAAIVDDFASIANEQIAEDARSIFADSQREPTERERWFAYDKWRESDC
jgi:hypothetical protein